MLSIFHERNCFWSCSALFSHGKNAFHAFYSHFPKIKCFLFVLLQYNSFLNRFLKKILQNSALSFRFWRTQKQHFSFRYRNKLAKFFIYLCPLCVAWDMPRGIFWLWIEWTLLIIFYIAMVWGKRNKKSARGSLNLLQKFYGIKVKHLSVLSYLVLNWADQVKKNIACPIRPHQLPLFFIC
jgi:hypothetical protein